jgi:Fur family ferric uptake transcriptional regulator
MIDTENLPQNSTPQPNLSGRLKRCGYRVTVPRQLIMDIFATTDRHLSAEEVYSLAHKINPNVGMATVYRTLELLVRMGDMMKFDFGQHKSRYELSSEFGTARHHHHIVCTDCGKIVNYTELVQEESDVMRQARALLEKKYHFNIKHHQVQFFGVCGKCAKRRCQ